MNRPALRLIVSSLTLLLPLGTALAGNNQALLQQAAANAHKQHQLQAAAAAARQHLLLTAHAAAAQQQLLLKARENFSKQQLLQQAHRPERLTGINGGEGNGAPVTSIRRERERED